MHMIEWHHLLVEGVKGKNALNNIEYNGYSQIVLVTVIMLVLIHILGFLVEVQKQVLVIIVGSEVYDSSYRVQSWNS